jgi:hypothetical protein
MVRSCCACLASFHGFAHAFAFTVCAMLALMHDASALWSTAAEQGGIQKVTSPKLTSSACRTPGERNWCNSKPPHYQSVITVSALFAHVYQHSSQTLAVTFGGVEHAKPNITANIVALDILIHKQQCR